MRWHIQVNTILCLFNYPLTMITQLLSKSERIFYMVEILALLLLKILIQFVSARVRADFENPAFHLNAARLKSNE